MLVIFDRQYSPFIFKFQEQLIVPAESVYAVFEAKQSLNAKEIGYARDKLESVRKLHRTSLPIPHAGGTFPAKSLIPIYGGIVTLESDWKPKFGDALAIALETSKTLNRLNFGCVAVHGCFEWDDKSSKYLYIEEGKPATSFLLKLISRLQFSGTVPMIDVQAYARWLK
jgi:hypothetical protein